MKKILIIMISMLLFSCTGSHVRECNKSFAGSVVIRWGEQIESMKVQKGYMLKSDTLIYEITKDSTQDVVAEKFIKTVKLNEVCYLRDSLARLIIKTQALGVVGDTTRFLSFENTKHGTMFFGQWNPKFPTRTNWEFMKIYEALDSIAHIK